MTISKEDASNNCWQFMNCPQDIRKDCLAYKSDTGGACWILNQISKRDGFKILGTCKRCSWFLKNNTDFHFKKQ